MSTEKPEGIFRCAERGTASPLANKSWIASGEYRAPKEGEWFVHVAGSRFREARRAHEDMADPQWIAVEVSS